MVIQTIVIIGVHYLEFYRMAAVVAKTPKSLYRHLLRRLSPLPAEAQEHYKHRIKQVPTKLQSFFIPPPGDMASSTFHSHILRSSTATQTSQMQRESSR